jgi:DNA-binding NarL/FixJ family response regulator
MPLTERQLEVLQLLVEGKSTDQIADELVISKTTVRNHIAHALANLGVHTRVQAVVAASRAGLIRIPPPEER